MTSPSGDAAFTSSRSAPEVDVDVGTKFLNQKQDGLLDDLFLMDKLHLSSDG